MGIRRRIDMLRIHFNNKDVYVSYDHGEWHVQPLTNSWLWLIGSLESGHKIEIKDERTTLQDHQHNMTFTIGKKDTNFTMLRKLLEVYQPKERGITTAEEVQLINETLQLKDRTIIDLRNLRDFVVAHMGRSEDLGDWDKMSAITYCIDHQLVMKGAEV
jgi:hypothetical protein